MFVLKLPCAGNIAWVLLAMLLMAVVAVLFGALLSIFANNEFQMIQMVPTTIVPQVFFSGLIELDTMPYHLGNICYVMPIYYGCATIKKVMVEGAGFGGIWPLLLVLLCLILLLAALNTFALRKYRRI
jgi:ABC-2 type transport system permease protein